jgi:uncharacterized protein (TIGR02996 family)
VLNNQAAFVAALTENEDDEGTRLIYADWLEEQGQYEEAQRQRQWTSAKAWLMNVVEQCGRFEDDGDNPYQKLCERARRLLDRHAAQGGDESISISCGYNRMLMDVLNSHREAFWGNWSIVTGVVIPEGFIQRSSFECC